MEKDDFENLLQQRNEEIKRHIGVLVESFDDKIKLVAEQHLSIMAVLERHTRDIESIKESILETNIRLRSIEDQMRRKVDAEELNKIERRLAVLEARVLQ